MIEFKALKLRLELVLRYGSGLGLKHSKVESRLGPKHPRLMSASRVVQSTRDSGPKHPKSIWKSGQNWILSTRGSKQDLSRIEIKTEFGTPKF